MSNIITFPEPNDQLSPEEMAMSDTERLALAAKLRASAEALRLHATALRDWWEEKEGRQSELKEEPSSD